MGVTTAVGAVVAGAEEVVVLAVVDGASAVLDPQEDRTTQAAMDIQITGEKRRM